MATTRMKSSIYLSSNLHERVKALSRATQLPFNTHVVLALEEYLQHDKRVALINGEDSQVECSNTKPSSF